MTVKNGPIHLAFIFSHRKYKKLVSANSMKTFIVHSYSDISFSVIIFLSFFSAAVLCTIWLIFLQGKSSNTARTYKLSF